MGMNARNDCRPYDGLQPLRFGIVGAGPTGTAVFERLVALAHLRPDLRIELGIWEPNELGVGQHRRSQPASMPLNTIASQINVFPGASPRWRNGVAGPSLDQWLQDRPATGHYLAWDYVPRRYCGEYLSEAFAAILRHAPDNVTVKVHRERVVAIVPSPSAQTYQLMGESGLQTRVDRLCLCLGHAGRRRTDRHAVTALIEQPYPLPDTLASIQPGEAIGVEGMGLVASDVIASLTIDRGGRFERQGAHLVYIASGQEPVIWLHSRSGMPFHARPFLPPARQAHRALVLNRHKIDRLRQGSDGGSKLDFAGQLLPLLKLEMRIAHRCADCELARPRIDAALRMRLEALVRPDDPTEALVHDVLAELDFEHGPFDVDQLFELTPPATALGEAYPAWVRRFLMDDLTAAELGLLASPRKAALEVCRDLRNVIRYAVDFEGLTETSHSDFYRRYAPLFNRLVGGPTIERNAQLVALLDAGVVRLPLGPAAVAMPLCCQATR